MLQLSREGRVIDVVKVRLGTIHDISLGGGGVGGRAMGWIFFGGGTWLSEGKDGNQSSPTG